MRILPAEIMDRIQDRLIRLYPDGKNATLRDRLAALASRASLPTPAPAEYWNQATSLLIAYGDMVQAPGERPLATLHRFAAQRLTGNISHIHILPFFPYSSDEGFSVIDYREVDPRLGNWEDLHRMGEDFGLMFDLVLNHCSRESEWFKLFSAGVAPMRNYFITMETDGDLSSVVRPRTSPLLTSAQTPNGERWVWTTFSADQVDLNFATPDVLFEFLEILLFYAENGARIIRLDAIAYLWKRPGTSCINLPETHEVVKLLRDFLEMVAPGTLLLTETNVPREQNISYFGAGDEAHMVYQFSLPPLLLHSLYTGSTRHLTAWAQSLPELPDGCTFLNFTASHDGIGVRPLEGLVSDEELRHLVEQVRHRGGHVSSRTGPDDQDIPYELNITYFDALADPGHPGTERHIDRFLCSQAIMLAMRGVPAVYFHSLTATPNDHHGVERTGQFRSINRRRWNADELNALLDDATSISARVFIRYRRLLRLRAEHPAFHPDGGQRVLDLPDGLFGLVRTAPDGGERIASISNLTNRPRNLELGAQLHAAGIAGCEGSCAELIRSEVEDLTGDGIQQLKPYETIWLVLPAPNGPSGGLT